jgi:hypothetical protein
MIATLLLVLAGVVVWGVARRGAPPTVMSEAWLREQRATRE